MNRFDDLAFFIRIIEKGGVAAAGRDFSLSPSTASDRLAELEAHYGAKLLTRTTRSFSLTDEGAVLLQGARHLVADAQDLRTRIKHGVERLSGRIRITATLDFGEKHIAPLVDAFMDQHRDIHIELYLSDGYVDLAGQGIDLAVRQGALKESSLRVKKIGPNRRVICAAPSYLGKSGTPAHPDELSGHNCLLMQFGTLIDREWRFEVNGRVKIVAVSGNRQSNSGAQVHCWCLAGRGIALKSIWDVSEDLKTGRLIELLKDYAPETEAALQIVYPGGGKPNRRVRALIDHLTTALKKRNL